MAFSKKPSHFWACGLAPGCDGFWAPILKNNRFCKTWDAGFFKKAVTSDICFCKFSGFANPSGLTLQNHTFYKPFNIHWDCAVTSG